MKKALERTIAFELGSGSFDMDDKVYVACLFRLAANHHRIIAIGIYYLDLGESGCAEHLE